MKKIFTLIVFIILLIACTGCKKNNNLDLEELYEQNIELASNHFLGWGTDVMKYEFIMFEPENATIYERSKFGECFSDDVEKILYVKYELSKFSPYVVAIQYNSVEKANESWLLDHSFYMQYENDLRILVLFQPTDLHDRIYKKMVQYNTNYYTSNGNENGILTNIAGVITPDNRCYSVLVNNLNHTPLMIDCKCGNNITIPQNIETNCCLII